MKFTTLKVKIHLWFFAVFFLVFILVTLPNIFLATPVYSTDTTTGGWFLRTQYRQGSHVPLRTDKSKILLAEECKPPVSGPARSPLNPMIPYIISPRRTFILTHQPKLRWNAVISVKSYTVSLLKGDKILWENKVNTNEVVYPGKPPLELGVEYLLIVKADNERSSQEEEQSARGFRLLPATGAKIVKTAIVQPNNQRVTDKVKALENAYIYSGSGLKSEAIETLEGLIASEIKEAFVYRQLGELYSQVGLTLLAQRRYEEAVKLAKTAGDVAEQAEISTALGDLYLEIDEEREAIDWLTQARDNYKTLGNKQRVRELDTQIQELKSVSFRDSPN
ncbi:tetratricopeptide repeat protein [Brasilonema sp. UFV-L1]|uniref:tetratricopeptide repeat protein n=1 Tax=Brasilonema sp. UFV-L1 TaxID=2234130 RepID=UPI00145DF56F|nr:tetratricopeptide repeat protein [Brasilonema sp. UFV-L1]NMG10188.1 hypothetical protein [Brasilonema sp. UFV-L1]